MTGCLVLLVLATITGHAAGASATVRAFVTNEKSDDVTVIDDTTGTVLKTIPVGKRPRGVAASPDGRRIYVANSNSNTVMVLDARNLTVIQSAPAGEDPEGLTVGVSSRSTRTG
jgi:YVTN family beta-propeller protein